MTIYIWAKIQTWAGDLRGKCVYFQSRDYPATPDSSFQSSNNNHVDLSHDSSCSYNSCVGKTMSPNAFCTWFIPARPWAWETLMEKKHAILIIFTPISPFGMFFFFSLHCEVDVKILRWVTVELCCCLLSECIKLPENRCSLMNTHPTAFLFWCFLFVTFFKLQLYKISFFVIFCRDTKHQMRKECFKEEPLTGEFWEINFSQNIFAELFTSICINWDM